MACVSYLDISGSPAHLRYLMRRLRQTLAEGRADPGRPVALEDAALTDKAIAAAIGADYFTSSLGDAVTACVEAAEHKATQALPAPPVLDAAA